MHWNLSVLRRLDQRFLVNKARITKETDVRIKVNGPVVRYPNTPVRLVKIVYNIFPPSSGLVFQLLYHPRNTEFS